MFNIKVMILCFDTGQKVIFCFLKMCQVDDNPKLWICYCPLFQLMSIFRHCGCLLPGFLCKYCGVCRFCVQKLAVSISFIYYCACIIYWPNKLITIKKSKADTSTLHLRERERERERERITVLKNLIGKISSPCMSAFWDIIGNHGILIIQNVIYSLPTYSKEKLLQTLGGWMVNRIHIKSLNVTDTILIDYLIVHRYSGVLD